MGGANKDCYCCYESGEGVKGREENNKSENPGTDAAVEADEVFHEKQEQRESKEGGAKLLMGGNEHKDTIEENEMSSEAMNQRHGHSSEGIGVGADSAKLTMKDEHDRSTPNHRVSNDDSKKTVKTKRCNFLPPDRSGGVDQPQRSFRSRIKVRRINVADGNDASKNEGIQAPRNHGMGIHLRASELILPN